MSLIRPANESDLVHASRIYCEALQTADWLPEVFSGVIDFTAATVGEDIYVAVSEECLVTGFISVWKADAFVHHLYVDSAFKRLGFGTALLDSLEAWLPRPWTLKCVAANVGALTFYRSLGWKTIGEGYSDDGRYFLLEY